MKYLGEEASKQILGHALNDLLMQSLLFNDSMLVQELKHEIAQETLPLE